VNNVKNWRSVRQKIAEMFEHDYVHYHRDEDYIEIRAKTFIGNELYNLFSFARKNRLWYYLDVAPNGDILIRVEKICW